MSLQARLRHPLGERWFELPERGVDQPIVVGRAGNADLQVPSATVGQRHCVLFVHEGRWVVQEVGGGGARTYVNGSKVDGAAFLHVGDVVSLGADAAAATIEIDPTAAAQGQAGQPAVGVAPPAQAVPPDAPPAYAEPYVAPQPVAPAAYPQGGYPPGVYPQAGYPPYPGGYPATYPVPTAPAGAQWPQQPAPAAADGAIADWPADATPRYSPSRRRRTSDGGSGVIIGMVLTLLITAGAGYWIYRHFGKPAPVVVAPAPATQSSAPPATRGPRDDPTGAPPSIFDAGQPKATPATAPRTTTRAAAGGGGAAPAQTPPGTGATDPQAGPGEMAGTGGDVPAVDTAPPQDPTAGAPVAADDPAWKQVEAARHLKDEAKAILQFEDYARTHPGAGADKIRQFTDQMLDRIWLERVENLCEQREELNRKIAEVDKDLAEETDEAHKKRVLTPLRQQYVNRIKNIDEELVGNMKYDGKSSPNLLDDAEVERLRQARDPQYYASWKNRVLAHIRRTHGELPWVATKSR